MPRIEPGAGHPAGPEGALAAVAVDWARYEAVLFDLDGVLTATARLHAAAWTRLFDGYLAERAAAESAPFRPFEPRDYARYVDGRPRYDGVRAFLASRGITLPDGAPGDPPGDGTVCGLGNRKQAFFHDVLAGEGADIDSRHGGGGPPPAAARACAPPWSPRAGTARRSSSRPASPASSSCRWTASSRRELGLAGKPAPDTFLHAARTMGIAPARAAVVEDAIAGVAAGRAGGFGLVVGIDRAGVPDELARAGADLVVTDLADTLPDGTLTDAAHGTADTHGGRDPAGRRARRPPTSRRTGRSRSRPRPPVRRTADGRPLPRRSPPRHLSRRRMAARRDALRPPPRRGVGVAVHDRQRLPRPARHLRRGPARGAPRHLRQRLPRDVAHRLRRRGVRLRQARPDHRRRARRQDHPAVRRRRAVLPADGDPRPLRAGARHAGGDPGPHPRVGPLVGPARLHPVAPARLPRAPAPRGDLLRGDLARLRRPRRHRLRDLGTEGRTAGGQRRPPHQAVRVRGHRAAGEPRRRPSPHARVLAPGRAA